MHTPMKMESRAKERKVPIARWKEERMTNARFFQNAAFMSFSSLKVAETMGSSEITP